MICLLVTAVVSYLYGSVRIGQRELRISKAARIQLAVIAGLYLLVQGASLWLDRYKTLVEPGDRITGPGYTGVNAIIPGMTILAIVAVVVAILFFVTAIIGRWRYPLIATALLIVSAIVVGVGYPWIVNTFQVQAEPARPRERVLPAQHRHDEGRVRHRRPRRRTPSTPRPRPKPVSCARTRRRPRRSASWTRRSSARRSVSSSSTARTTSSRTRSTSTATRSTASRRTRSSPLRELNVDQLGAATSWQNSTLVYTHGYGLVAAAGNERTTDGNPVFLERGIPATGFLVGQRELRAAGLLRRVLGALLDRRRAEGTDPIELDYPSGTDGADRDAHDVRGQRRAERRQRLQPADLRAQVPVRADPLLGLPEQGLADPVRPRPERARAEGGAVPRARQRPVPERRGRPHRLDHRRLHAERQLPVLDAG